MKTREYSLFKLTNTNRPISKSRVELLKKSIIKYGYFNSKPITVTRDFIVSDGQHRLKACVDLNLPIVYEVDDISPDESMVVLNSTSATWRLNEFINHYAERGIVCYSELRDLIVKHPKLGVSNCITIYSGVCGGNSKKIRDGAQINKSKKINECIDLVMFFSDKINFWSTSKFVRGIVSFLNDKTTEQKHIDRLKQNAFGMVECAKAEQYAAMFNKMSRKRKK